MTAGSRSRRSSPTGARGSPASPPRCRPRPRPGRPTASSPRAEHARAEGADTPATWLAAVTAWRRAAEPYPLSYALLRLAEARTAAGDLDAAAGAVRESHALARRLGAAPIAAEAEALARRARLACREEPADLSRGRHGRPAGRAAGRRPAAAEAASAEAGRRAGPLRPHRPRARGPRSSSPPAGPTRRSPGRCSSARRPPACTSPTSSPSSASAAGSRPPRSPTASASPASGSAGRRRHRRSALASPGDGCRQ